MRLDDFGISHASLLFRHGWYYAFMLRNMRVRNRCKCSMIRYRILGVLQDKNLVASDKDLSFYVNAKYSWFIRQPYAISRQHITDSTKAFFERIELYINP